MLCLRGTCPVPKGCPRCARGASALCWGQRMHFTSAVCAETSVHAEAGGSSQNAFPDKVHRCTPNLDHPQDTKLMKQAAFNTDPSITSPPPGPPPNAPDCTLTRASSTAACLSPTPTSGCPCPAWGLGAQHPPQMALPSPPALPSDQGQRLPHHCLQVRCQIRPNF